MSIGTNKNNLNAALPQDVETSEIRYRRLFESARDGILLLDKDARKITDANPFMTELLSYTHSELLGKELWEIGLMKDREESLKAFQELQEAGYIRYEDLPLKTKEGKCRQVEFVSNVYQEGERQVIQCNIRDITERKRIEKERDRYFTLSVDMLCLANLGGFFERVNPAFEKILGYAPEELLFKPITTFLHPSDQQALMAEYRSLAVGGSPTTNLENRWRCKDGSYRWIAWSYFPIVAEGIAYGVGRDITESKAAQEALRERDDLLQGIFDSVSSEMVVVDADGIITHVSKSWGRFAQENRTGMYYIGVGMKYFHICAEEEGAEGGSAQASMDGIRAVVEGSQPGFVLEYSCHTPHRQRWIKMQVDPRSREVGGAVITHTDITESKLAAERAAYVAFHDGLTGLPNRALFLEHLLKAVARAERHQDYLYAVLFVDLDRFKFINDTLGHLAGDQFLVHVAGKMKSIVRGGDVIARLGGDEFTILLSDIGSIRDAIKIAGRINKELSRPLRLAGHEVFTTASIGITLSKHGYISTEDVLRDADTAMYRAKTRGGGRYEIFDPSMQANLMALLKLEEDLRGAVERQEFCLHYQPIVSLEDNRISGFEALVRWQHPERGLLWPDEFIPLAEETGLIMPIGKWVMREACLEARKWQDWSHRDLPLSVNVNLSAKEFSQFELVEQVSSILGETGLSAQSLKLEITESAVMEKSQVVSRMLEQLKNLGIKLQLDDFGTGYSSLSNLHDFPVDVLKIDRSFVRRMGPGGENSEIVQTIIQLAHNLGMKVTAEGVGTIEQLSQLRHLGCEYGQGYYFSKPVDGEKVKAMIVN